MNARIKVLLRREGPRCASLLSTLRLRQRPDIQTKSSHQLFPSRRQLKLHEEEGEDEDILSLTCSSDHTSLFRASATSWADEQCSLLARQNSHISHPALYPPRRQAFHYGTCHAPSLCTGCPSSEVPKMSPWCGFHGFDSQTHPSFVTEGQLSGQPVVLTVELGVQTRYSMLPPGM